mgnify:CR=1 FL=1
MLSDNIKILRKKKGYSQETLAEQLHVKNLVLYHTEDKNIARRQELYRAEGETYFTGNLLIPEDMDVIEL